MGKGSVRATIASEGYLSDMHDQVFITKNDEHVEEISMKQRYIICCGGCGKVR